MKLQMEEGRRQRVGKKQEMRRGRVQEREGKVGNGGGREDE